MKKNDIVVLKENLNDHKKGDKFIVKSILIMNSKEFLALESVDGSFIPLANSNKFISLKEIRLRKIKKL